MCHSCGGSYSGVPASGDEPDPRSVTRFFLPQHFNGAALKGARGFSSSTIFSTNNFRQFTAALTEVVLNQNEEQKDKARFFGGTLVSFHAGVAVSFLLWQMFHVHDAWFVLIPAAAAGVQMVRHLAAEKEKKGEIIPERAGRFCVQWLSTDKRGCNDLKI